MMNLTLKIDPRQMRTLRDVLKETPRKIDNVLARAINNTVKDGVKATKKTMKGIIAVKTVKNAKGEKFDPLKRTFLPGRKATPNSLKSLVRIDKTKRLALKYFGATQTKAGMSYRIDKKGPRGFIKSAFTGSYKKPSPKLGGNVWVRESKSRLPIRRKFGVSPWGIFVKKKMKKPTTAEIKKRLDYQVKRLTREVILRQQGIIKANRGSILS